MGLLSILNPVTNLLGLGDAEDTIMGKQNPGYAPGRAALDPNVKANRDSKQPAHKRKGSAAQTNKR